MIGQTLTLDASASYIKSIEDPILNKEGLSF
jgi:hypothetical protein